MAATGKSTLARELSRRLDVKVFRSDVIRKKIFSHVTVRKNKTSFKEGIYSKQATSLTYGKLFMMAQEEVDLGNSVILDATFSSKNHRREALRLAENMDVNIVFVECRCRDAIIRKRLEKRDTKTSISDARPELFENLKDDYETMDEIPSEIYLTVDTEQPMRINMEKIFSHLDLPVV
jgi:predicted kinase